MKLKHILLTLLCLAVLAAPAAAAGGAGTAASPYIIQTPAELQSIANDLSAHYALGNDIDMSGYSFTPIGSTAAPFHGSLDGRGCTIRNLEINLPSTQYVGLFAVITAGTTIKNLNFESCTISGAANTGTLYGRCIGISGVTTPFEIDDIDIENCVVTSSSNIVGGVCGAHTSAAVGSLKNCDVVACDISSTSSSHVGGVCGYLAYSQATNVTLQNCVVDNCHIWTSSYNAGGVCGYLAHSQATGYVLESTVKNCIIESTSSSNVGGVCGYLTISQATGYANDNVVENCVITGSSNVGGVCGYLADSQATGYANDNVVENCSVKAHYSYAGGIAGCKYASGFGAISDCAVKNSTVQASSYAGGICSTFTRT